MRLRREYLYRKAQEDRARTIEDKKHKLKSALDGMVFAMSLRIYLQPTTLYKRNLLEAEIVSCDLFFLLIFLQKIA